MSSILPKNERKSLSWASSLTQDCKTFLLISIYRPPGPNFKSSLNESKAILESANLSGKGLSVNEGYNYLWTVHRFDVETFEFSVPAEFVLMTWSVYKIFLSSECGVSFYWGPARVKFDSSLFWNYVLKTDPHSLLSTE